MNACLCHIPILCAAVAQKQLAKFKMAEIVFALDLPRLRGEVVQFRASNLARTSGVAFRDAGILDPDTPKAFHIKAKGHRPRRTLDNAIGRE